jgi:hypothetical protein
LVANQLEDLQINLITRQGKRPLITVIKEDPNHPIKPGTQEKFVQTRGQCAPPARRVPINAVRWTNQPWTPH